MTSERDVLLSLQAVRERAGKVLQAAESDSLNHFSFHASRMAEVVDYVTGVIDRDFGPDKYEAIPPHGRWQHFDVGGVSRVDALLTQWGKEPDVDSMEITRRLIDLFFVSVLLDAGAGDVWRFSEAKTGAQITRSEGIAVASMYMFLDGAFSSDTSCSVDCKGLMALTEQRFIESFQISDTNPMVGTSSRVQLLQAVGKSLSKLPDIFGPNGRPGHLVDHLIKGAGGSKVLGFQDLWSCLQELLIPSWPGTRTTFQGYPIGDAWPLAVLASQAQKEGDEIQPFHKLTQWLAYSLSVPFQRLLGYEWKDLDLGTGLPEYRNGGLFVDLGVLTLRPAALEAGLKASGQSLPIFEASSDVIVEWRAMTVALLDQLHDMISKRYSAKGVTLTMPQMLEAGTWKSGRELAAAERPETKSSPILVISDGTLY